MMSITLNYKEKLLFLNHMKRMPADLGMKDEDLIFVSIKPPELSHESALKQLREDKSRNNPINLRKSKGKAKGNRKKS